LKENSAEPPLLIMISARQRPGFVASIAEVVVGSRGGRGTRDLASGGVVVGGRHGRDWGFASRYEGMDVVERVWNWLILGSRRIE
jgi:hypothetical protein